MSNAQSVIAFIERWILIGVIVVMGLHPGGCGGTPVPPPWPSPNPSPLPYPPGPTPGPPPAPEPNPVPAPKPFVGEMHVTLVYDPQAMTQDVAAVRASVTVRPALKAMDAIWRNFPANDKLIVDAHLPSYAADIGLPCVLVQDAGGKVIHKFRLSTEAALVDQVRAIREGR